jgi:hypothetical protein
MSIASAKSADDVLPIGDAGCVSESGWYVVHTHVHSEAKAAAHLAQTGVAANAARLYRYDTSKSLLTRSRYNRRGEL